jgi:hypothetical protein
MVRVHHRHPRRRIRLISDQDNGPHPSSWQVGPSSSRSSSARRKPCRRLPTTTANSASPEATVAQPPLPGHIPECSPDRGQHVTVRVLPNYPLWDQDAACGGARVQPEHRRVADPDHDTARGLSAVLGRDRVG